MTVQPTAIWRVRISGNDLNGGGFDPGLAGAGTDRSRQNGAFVTFNGTTVTASGTTATLTLSGLTGSAADIGNCLHIASGTNLTAGFYFITAATSSTWTLDRNPVSTGTGSALVGRMGGGWATLTGNCVTTGPVVAGNTVYILGSGTPNPSSYTYDYTVSSAITLAIGNTTNGLVTFANDPDTPGYMAPPDTTGGMPVIGCGIVANAPFTSQDQNKFLGLYFVNNVASFNIFFGVSNSSLVFVGCVYDQFNLTTNFSGRSQNNSFFVIGCEFFSSVAASADTSFWVLFAIAQSDTFAIYGSNFHDTRGGGISAGNIGAGGNFSVSNNIVSNTNGGYGITMDGGGICVNNTVDDNAGGGIQITPDNALLVGKIQILNNIISNHTVGGTFGLNISAGTTARNDVSKGLIDYNTFYNNTSNYGSISAGPHDTALVSDPYVASATENYTLK